jgi:hypothetical protein
MRKLTLDDLDEALVAAVPELRAPYERLARGP